VLALAFFFLCRNTCARLAHPDLHPVRAVACDPILGYGGIVTLGHSAFFGLGAYTAGIVARSSAYRTVPCSSGCGERGRAARRS
jgi:branched-chain amino acid transport system permease protein